MVRIGSQSEVTIYEPLKQQEGVQTKPAVEVKTSEEKEKTHEQIKVPEHVEKQSQTQRASVSEMKKEVTEAIDKNQDKVSTLNERAQEIFTGVPPAPPPPPQIKPTQTKISTVVKPMQEMLREKIQDISQKSQEKKIEKNTGLLQNTVDDSVKAPEKTYGLKTDEMVSSITGSLKKSNISGFVKDQFGEAILKSGHFTTNQKKLLAETGKKAQMLMMSVVPQSDLFYSLMTRSETEMKNEIAKAIGETKEKHAGKTYEQLPKNKQELVDSIYLGMKKGLPAVMGQVSELYAKKVDSFISDKFKNDNKAKDYAFSAAIRSSDDLKMDIIKSLKIVPDSALVKDNFGETSPKTTEEVMSGLTNDQKNLVNSIHKSMSEAINKNLPDKTSTDRVELKVVKDGVESVFKPVKEFTLNGKTYVSPKFLGEGGLANAFKYVNKNDPTDSVVVKELKMAGKEKREEMVTELKAHRHAMNPDSEKTGHKNVVDLKGVLKGPDDTLMMVVNLAGGGDLDKVSNKIGKAVTDGKISKEVQSLLTRHLLRDVMEGMKYIQSDRNMQHLDVKPQNFLIKSDGTAMVADFGTSRTSHEGWTSREFETTKDYLSPEIASRFERGTNLKMITEKSDTWSIGAMLHRMTGGELEFGKMKNYFMSEHEANIRKFGEDTTNRIRKTTPEHPQLDELDKLVNAMMHPDPAQRPNLSSVAQHSLFTDPKLDSPALKQLLEAVISGDEHRIQALSKEVEQLAH